MTYYYGIEDTDIYTETDPYQAAMDLCVDLECDQVEIFEMKVSRDQDRWCRKFLTFIENSLYSECGGICKKYSPQNGRSGKCAYQSWGLVHTGRVLLISADGKLLKTISARDK